MSKSDSKRLTGPQLLASLTLTGAAALPLSAVQLPTPCTPGTCAAPNPAFAANPAFVSSGKATLSQSGNKLTVNQQTNQAILNWLSFNISADGIVQFVQPSSSSIALNRIYQQNPSSIFGQLTANGQVYLVNPNGFLFGPTAQVNTAGIIASSLQISDANFNAGLLAPQILGNYIQSPYLAAALSAWDASGNPLYTAGDVTVDAGAQISSPGGRILLAAPNVWNSGTLSAPDGQVVLAAGQQVFLQASTNTALRGLIVEVDGGGTAANQLSGLLSADRGNISLIGLAVNQDGRISASTSVSANGSVRLEAADTVTGFSSGTIAASHAGTLELGPDSSIELLPEYSSSATAVAGAESTSQSQQLLLQSNLSLTGAQVDFEGGKIIAPDANLTVTATANPYQAQTNAGSGVNVQADGNPAEQIRIHPGTTIDLSGSDADLPMSANLLTLQLRANELSDDPTQRNGALRGQTVYIDMRVGTSIIGPTALQEAESAVPYSVAYWTERGGTASFQSEGDIVVSPGATINVSGGHSDYASGVIQTSMLVGANGQLYNVGTANPLMTYTGVINPTVSEVFNTWGVGATIVSATPGLSHYDTGYVQGASAGSIQFAAPAMALGGTLLGQAVNGPYQRTSATAATGGTLILGLPLGINPQAGGNPDYLTPAIDFVAQAAPIGVADGTPMLTQPLQLPVDFLLDGGFQNTQIYGNTSVTLPSGLPLNLIPGSSFSIDATRIDVLSNIASPGGSVQLQSVYTSPPVPDLAISRPGIRLGDGVTIDVSGQWTNDTTLVGPGGGNGPTLQNGGKITLNQGIIGGELVLGDAVDLKANGGAWLSSSDALTSGQGGSISILDSPFQVNFQIGTDVALAAFGVEGAKGGTFALSAPRLLIDSGSAGGAWISAQDVDDLLAPGNVLNVGAPLFSDYGFGSISLTATGPIESNALNNNILTVQAGTQINAIEESLLLGPSYAMRPSGRSINGFSSVGLLPEFQRPAASVSLSASLTANAGGLTGLLDVETGSAITTDPLGAIMLAGAGGVAVDGVLRAPGGTITLRTPWDGQAADFGYNPTLAIELGPDSVVDVSGTFVQTPSQIGLQLGQVLPGGTINLFADRGTAIADAGSLIDVAGTSAALDIPKSMGSGVYMLYDVGSAGGSLSVRSPESVSLRGTIEAAAGAGNYGDPAGGSFELDLTEAELSWFTPVTGLGATPLPSVPLVIQLVSSTAGNPADTAGSGIAQLGIAQLEAAGFDSLHLVAGNEIQLGSSTPLQMARQIVLDAPELDVFSGTQATLVANYVSLGDSQQVGVPPADVLLPGSGAIDVQAQRIDLAGAVGVLGAQTVTLNSAGDVELLGVSVGAAQPTGELELLGNLTINAARVYPATQTNFAIDALGPGSAVTVGQTSASPGTPLSAGGVLSISADRIDSTGTMIAPFGSIDLTAATSLTLEPGSVTAVSASGALIPYGQTQLGGTQWIYSAANANLIDIAGIPQRQVQLSAPAVTVAPGATLNIAGGGNLQAYEWVPGTGGTHDALSANSATSGISGLYAIVPTLGSVYAPYDPQESGGTLASGANIYQPGSSVYLGASVTLGNGVTLAAGTYALLPARYALIPGAFLVQVQSGYANIVPGQKAALVDGTPVVAGYTTFGTTGQHSGGYEGIAVWEGGNDPNTSYAQQLASYTISDAQSFFAAAATQTSAPPPLLPSDAGRLSVNVVNSLTLQGTLLASAVTKGSLAGEIDIGAPSLEVTGSSAAVPTGTVGISAAEIDSWQAGDVVLGGSLSAGGSTLTVVSNSVTLAPGAQLQAGQVIVVAGQSIDLQTGSSLLSNSATSSGVAPSFLPTATPITLEGNLAAGAALLAVSDLELPQVVRSSGGSAPATLTLESGSTVGSLGALSIDAPGTVTLAGTLKGSGATWSLASTSIGLLGQGSAGDSMVINSAALSEMQGAGSLYLTGLQSIDIAAPLQLGTVNAAGSANAGAPVISSLNLTAPAINLGASVQQAGFTAGTITVAGMAGAPDPAPTAGAGTVIFNATSFDVGAGAVAISGAAQVSINASGAFLGTAAASQPNAQLATSGNLTIAAPVMTAANGGTLQVSAPTGTLSLSTPTGAVAVSASAASGVGAEVDLTANSIVQDGLILAPGGNINLQATQNLTVGSGAQINAGGVNVAIGNQVVGTEGGRVYLTAGGNLSLAANSLVSVSGAGDAPAGELHLTAGGAADIEGNLQGQPGAAAESGLFTLDAGSFIQGQSLTTLSTVLQAGGFGQEIGVHLGTGSLVLGAGSQLTANQVTLTADTGEVDIAGTISAPNSDLRGSIGLFGATGVLIESSGQLHADTTGGTQLGGNIELGTNAGGNVTLESNSVLTANGSAADGSLLIRAPLVNNNTDIAVAMAGSNVSQFGQIYIEPVFIEQATKAGEANFGKPLAADYARIWADVNGKMASSVSNIEARLNPGASPLLQVRAAIDLEQSGNLTLTTAPNFSNSSAANLWRFNGESVDLTVRATGAVTVGTTFSDGFETTTRVRQSVLSLYQPTNGSTYESASMRFVAGADQNSPNPLGIVTGSDQTLQLGTNKSGAPNGIVRTGTGEIDLVASGNICFAAGCAVAGDTSGEVYTAGVPGAPSVALPNSTSTFNFPTAGGNVFVNAGAGIVGGVITNALLGVGGASITSWQIRQGSNTTITGPTPVQWGDDLNQYTQYGWNLGSLGGGDVRVTVGGDISNLTAAAADSFAANSATGTSTLFASGGLEVRAAGNIGTGMFYSADGKSMLNAGGAFDSARSDTSGPVGSLIALDGSQVTVEARTGILIDDVLNPTVMNQAATANGLASSYFTYTDASTLAVQSSAGTVAVEDNSTHRRTLIGQPVEEGPGGAVQLFPASMIVRGLTGDVTMPAGVMFPSDDGELEVVAGRDINTSGELAMSDAYAAEVATPATLSGTTNLAGQYYFQSGRHSNDPLPAIIEAGRDINSVSLSTPKATDIIAGRDIYDLTFSGQNVNPSDVTLISAGRNFTDSLDGFGISSGVQVGGPGTVDVLAGGNINLGFSFGIVTVGSLANPNLPYSAGASLTVMAGLGQSPDYSAFLHNILPNYPTYVTQLVAYVEALTGQTGLTYSEVVNDLGQLDASQQVEVQNFLNTIFFDQLNTSGYDDNTIPGAGFSLGYAAIDTLFPNSRTAVATGPSPYAGNLTLDFSRIYTEDGGAIALLTPGGGINVGLANAPPSVPPKTPSQLGIVTEGPGDVSIYTKNDVNVNASRIFTLGGGNILIWSDEGSIDAGQGAKTSVSAPPPIVLVNSAGQVTLDFAGAVAGSGIRTIQVEPTVPPGNVSLIAPLGTVNAGDAGIGASGNINIAAAKVLGLDNIQFGGTATGVPSQVSDIGVALSGASSAASSTSNAATSNSEDEARKAAETAAPLAQAALSWLDVFVTGLGEENCRPDDLECLKRQKSAEH